MSDEGFHEIQLNGKQLVFLFMAATVVSVVIFLCGVMVGRGVRAERGPVDAVDATLSAAPAVEPAGGPRGSSSAPDARRDEALTPPPGQEPPANAEDDVYTSLMEGNDGAREKLKAGAQDPRKAESLPTPSRSAEMVDAPAPATPDPKKAEARSKPEKAETAAKTVAPPARADGGPTEPGTYAVQIAALRERAEADAIARRLAGKGYAAYVLVPAVGATPVYKVQVGRFRNRSDAEKTAARLKKEEQYSPWVTR